MELLLISRSRRSAEAGVFPIGRDRGCAGPRLGMSDEPIKTESNILPFGLRGPRPRLMKIPIVNRPVLRREIFGPSISISCGISLPDVLGWTRNYCEFLSALPLQRRTRSPILDVPIVWIDSMDRKKSWLLLEIGENVLLVSDDGRNFLFDGATGKTMVESVAYTRILLIQTLFLSVPIFYCKRSVLFVKRDNSRLSLGIYFRMLRIYVIRGLYIFSFLNWNLIHS